MNVPGVQSDRTVGSVQAVVEIAQNMAKDGVPVELEVRFGRCDHGRFTPGMSPEQMDRIVEEIRTCRDWTAVTDDWVLSMLFFHGSTIPGDTRTLRTESIYRSATTHEVNCIEKRLIQNSTYAVDLSELPGDGAAPTDFRVAVAVENKVPNDDIPFAERPTRCTVRMRLEFLYTPLGRSRPAWSFMLTRRWSAADFHQALLNKEMDPPQCDIELELIDQSYLQSTESDKLTFKMLWKVYDIIGMLTDTDLRVDDFSFRQVR
jgi:hypothetical protein